MQMTCIAYRNSSDINVQFEDGTVIMHKKWSDFIKGSISNLHTGVSMVNSDNKIGVKSIATNGMQMTCIAYRGCSDIDIQFEDGTVVEHKAWGSFIKGSIRNPHVGTSKV